MFTNCSSLNYLNINNFNTINTTNMNKMFYLNSKKKMNSKRKNLLEVLISKEKKANKIRITLLLSIDSELNEEINLLKSLS